jgi:hypothetical protein
MRKAATRAAPKIEAAAHVKAVSPVDFLNTLKGGA